MKIKTGYEKREEPRVNEEESGKLIEVIKNSPLANIWWAKQLKLSEKSFYKRIDKTVNFTISEALKIKEIAEITKSL